ncbi:MAG: hypothetical protein D6696_06705 [Acidobacteria bacterium]|nr:MAG: hypothetical protein D6696_06705 [Acidobacteriota bacterium]
MKSAYELALERLQAQGIEPPREDALDDATRAAMAEVRRKAKAKLAELEIMHRQRLREIDPAARREEEEGYQRERRRIEDECERRLAELRRAAG